MKKIIVLLLICVMSLPVFCMNSDDEYNAFVERFAEGGNIHVKDI
jgi:hypothetical protein